MTRNENDDTRTEAQVQLCRFMQAFTHSLLHTVLRYEPDTGKLYWRKRPPWLFKDGGYPAARLGNQWNGVYAGKEAFTACNTGGYRHGSIFSWFHKAHRVIWALQTGAWPEAELDHINHDRVDNRWCNLRESTSLQNSQNLTMYINNTSGFMGVTWHKNTRRWYARITVEGKNVPLGSFARKEDAIAARKAAEIKYDFHHNHGQERAHV